MIGAQGINQNRAHFSERAFRKRQHVPRRAAVLGLEEKRLAGAGKQYIGMLLVNCHCGRASTKGTRDLPILGMRDRRPIRFPANRQKYEFW